jgi:hypothetical protein
MRGLPIIVLALASCSTRTSEPTEKLSDQLIIDCVGNWAAGKVSLKFWGNHPDYAPDSGEIWREDRQAEPLRYFVGGKQMHLWLEHGRTRQSVDFDLVTTEDSKFVLKYELRFKQAVVGAKVYQGAMAKSFRCEPRKKATE